jgi:hypothetical protein
MGSWTTGKGQKSVEGCEGRQRKPRPSTKGEAGAGVWYMCKLH